MRARALAYTVPLMNTTRYTKIETAALDLMLQEAIRNQDKEMYAIITDCDESAEAQAKVQSLLDRFFR